VKSCARLARPALRRVAQKVQRGEETPSLVDAVCAYPPMLAGLRDGTLDVVGGGLLNVQVRFVESASWRCG
jgi:hypothetical protein